jgi:hypothetical protein
VEKFKDTDLVLASCNCFCVLLGRVQTLLSCCHGSEMWLSRSTVSTAACMWCMGISGALTSSPHMSKAGALWPRCGDVGFRILWPNVSGPFV